MATMTAAVYHGPRDVRIETVEVPAPGPGELLVRVGTVGVCGTDAAEWSSGPHLHPLHTTHPATGHVGPTIPGHEFSGTVEAVGAGVASGWLGTLVASTGSVSCGTCPACGRGESNQCDSYAGVGLHRHGALAEFVVTPAYSCVDAGSHGLGADEAALCQPMAIAVHAARRAGQLPRGSAVVVQGVGGVGVFLVFALVRAGLEVIATDVDEARLELARAMGATLVRNVGAGGEGPLPPALLREADVRAFFEVSGSEAGLATALESAPRGCRIVLLGIQKHRSSVDLARLTLHEQTLVGTNALAYEADLPRAAGLIAEGQGLWARVAPTVVPLSRLVEDALAPLAAGHAAAVKTLVAPHDAIARPFSASRSV
ncbi:MAG: alcohol dehydrogenase catalytic domain-containing protein [Nocardioidaceae bacterium]|nr:alcohol dehydrogenase catalytic domain-containing protein [Nocardioidaceae bacterium]